LSSEAAQAGEVEQGKRQEPILLAAEQAAEGKFSTIRSASMDTRHSVRLFLFSSEQAAQAEYRKLPTLSTETMVRRVRQHMSRSTIFNQQRDF